MLHPISHLIIISISWTLFYVLLTCFLSNSAVYEVHLQSESILEDHAVPPAACNDGHPYPGLVSLPYVAYSLLVKATVKENTLQGLLVFAFKGLTG